MMGWNELDVWILPEGIDQVHGSAAGHEEDSADTFQGQAFENIICKPLRIGHSSIVDNNDFPVQTTEVESKSVEQQKSDLSQSFGKTRL